MKAILSVLQEHYTIYTLFMMLISSAVLIFMDRRDFGKKNLKKESRFAYIAGILYAVLGIILYLISSL